MKYIHTMIIPAQTITIESEADNFSDVLDEAMSELEWSTSVEIYKDQEHKCE